MGGCPRSIDDAKPTAPPQKERNERPPQCYQRGRRSGGGADREGLNAGWQVVVVAATARDDLGELVVDQPVVANLHGDSGAVDELAEKALRLLACCVNQTQRSEFTYASVVCLARLGL